MLLMAFRLLRQGAPGNESNSLRQASSLPSSYDTVGPMWCPDTRAQRHHEICMYYQSISKAYVRVHGISR